MAVQIKMNNHKPTREQSSWFRYAQMHQFPRDLHALPNPTRNKLHGLDIQEAPHTYICLILLVKIPETIHTRLTLKLVSKNPQISVRYWTVAIQIKMN